MWRKIWAAVLTVLLPETILAHAIVERAAAIKSLQELKNDHDRKIDDLEISEPWSLWTRLRDLMCCYSVQAPGSPEAGVEMGKPGTKWTLTHSYYANMGGLRLGTSTGAKICSHYQTIALTTRQFGFLRKTYVIKESPRLSQEEIKDKSKTDFFTKGITVLQISELILSLITELHDIAPSRNWKSSQLRLLHVL
jgi:hypothetical protein